MNKFEIKYNNTAEKMRKALLTLIERKSFKDITISEICSVAKVNRTTFYLHYNNVLDLLTEISDSLVRDFISGFSEKIELKDMENYPTEKLVFNTPHYLAPYLEFVKENKAIYRIFINNYGKLNSEYAQNTDLFFSTIIKKNGINDPLIINYMSRFYLTGVNAIILEWINGNCKDDIAKICEIIALCTKVKP
ncbi:MAG: TetR family transcriptional regulator C-terminal domain-containing protein [Corallococcus sp.]|nr:TetR family transcriptional regulator C-terminal domain-containing protein [Corallococcus sp.]